MKFLDEETQHKNRKESLSIFGNDNNSAVQKKIHELSASRRAGVGEGGEGSRTNNAQKMFFIPFVTITLIERGGALPSSSCFATGVQKREVIGPNHSAGIFLQLYFSPKVKSRIFFSCLKISPDCSAGPGWLGGVRLSGVSLCNLLDKQFFGGKLSPSQTIVRGMVFLARK